MKLVKNNDVCVKTENFEGDPFTSYIHTYPHTDVEIKNDMELLNEEIESQNLQF